ncbi:MAG: CvpA family protein [Salibacteraceae bacterium]
MNVIDILLLVPLAWAAYRGFTKGLIIEIATLIGLITGIYGGVHFSYLLGDQLRPYVEWSERVLNLAAFAITFLGIVLLVFLLAKALEKVVNLVALKLVNKLAGSVFSILKMGLILSVVLLFFNALDARLNILTPEQRQASLLLRPVSVVAPTLVPLLDDFELDTDWIPAADSLQSSDPETGF